MQTHVRNPIASLVLAGDNVYVQGESEHFENALDKPYRQFVEAGVRILPVLGNHDVPLDRGRAQLAYLGLGAKRWYKTTLAAGDVELFAIDTTLHVTDEFSYLTPAANAWRIRHAEKQKSWLAESLAASTARYKVIVGHHPLYSSGSRAGERYQLRGEIGDIIDHGNVAAYVAGHQHIYERREPIHGVVHFVTGGGGRDPALLGGRGRLPNVHFLENHFTLFTASPAGLEYQAIAIDGSTIDSGIIAPR